MPKPVINEMLEWLKDVALLAAHYDAIPSRANDANYYAIRAILEQKKREDEMRDVRSLCSGVTQE